MARRVRVRVVDLILVTAALVLGFSVVAMMLARGTKMAPTTLVVPLAK